MKKIAEPIDFMMAVIENVPFGIMAVDRDGMITLCNEKALEHLNISEEKEYLAGRGVIEFLQDFPELAGKLTGITEDGKEAFDLVAAPFGKKYLTVKARPVLNGMMFTTEDVTSVKKMELATLNAMLEGQEEERRRIAKEIHDGIGPLMSTIKLNLDSVKMEMEPFDREVTRKIEAMEELLNMISSDIRSISHDLMPSVLLDFGLVAALENLCQKANQSKKVTVQFYQSGMNERLNLNTALGLYRIAQELLNNAFKYARAKRIDVQLIRHPETVVLMVEDDGIGVDPEALKTLTEKGIGLRNIKTRTKTLGGTMSMETQPGEGMLITVEVPFKKRNVS